MNKNKIVLIVGLLIIITGSIIFITDQVLGVTLAGDLYMGTNQIKNLGGVGSPDYDAANKAYVDSVLSIIENRDNITGDPAGSDLVTGKIWICTDVGGDCQ